jgi:uncharacterized protein YdeI (YjbR/CyaY-like superfamily)
MPETLAVRDCAEWREWLAKHHDSVSEIWLVFYKGKASLGYEEAVNEALCYGWVDSLIKRLDDERYARKFTPRKPDSRWSTLNRRRYAKLQAEGRLMPPGLERPPTDKSGDSPIPRELKELPAYIQKELKKTPAAWKNFEGLPPSHKRMYVGWIDSAKREETKLKRLTQAVGMLTRGERLGLK